MDALDQLGGRLSLRDLRMFITVAEQGNLAKAAKSLSISRPVVSKSIANLERVLGVRLLDRSPQRMELTSFGHALLKRSAAVFDELRQGVSELKFMTKPNSGELRIGALTRHYSGFAQAEKEIESARVWAGIHTRTADEHGTVLGRRIGELAVQRAMKPMGQ